ncbi:MAG: DUF4097 family beta strand repeat protein [Oscillospiraceae bacterium]|nr:DUF4097 family beta strand repeat protein [Oscillospiraceae bacterium]
MKNKTLVTLLVIALLLIAAGIAVGGGMGWSYSPFRGSYEMLVTLETSEFDAIRAEMLECDLRFYESWDDTAEAYASGRAVRHVTAALDGRTLVITESASDRLERLFRRDSYDDYAAVWLPSSFTGRIEAVSVSGDITLSDLPGEGIRASVTTDSGDVSVYDCRLPALTVTAADGDVSLYDDEIAALSVTTDSGDVWLGDLRVEKADILSGSGTVYGSLCDSDSADVTIVSDTGDVYVDY